MMMIDIDWIWFGLGALAGAGAAALFLAGLAAGLHLALKRHRPAPVLLISAMLRLGALLAVLWVVAAQGISLTAGFVLGFLLLRTLVLAVVRSGNQAEVTTCN